VLEARMPAAIGDAKTCPHGHPIQPGQRVMGVPLGDVAPGAKVTILRFENEAEDLLAARWCSTSSTATSTARTSRWTRSAACSSPPRPSATAASTSTRPRVRRE
jgi:hypothetical protein